jgi:hypothetical protein
MKRTNFYLILAALVLCAGPAMFAAAKVGESARTSQPLPATAKHFASPTTAENM